MNECKPLARGVRRSIVSGGGGGSRRGVGPGVYREGCARPRAGKAVHVDPIRPTSKAPGTKRLKLEYDELLSNSAFTFNLRHYIQVCAAKAGADSAAAAAAAQERIDAGVAAAEARAAEERQALMDGVAALVGQFVSKQEATSRWGNAG